MQLTAAGHQLIDRARGLLREIEQLREMTASGLPGQVIRVGSISTAVQSIVPDTLVRLIRDHPHLQVQIEQDTSMNLYDAVQRGELGAAFCIHPHFPLPKTFGWRTLRKEPLVVLVPPRLARRDAHEVLRTEPLTLDRERLSRARGRFVPLPPLERMEPRPGRDSPLRPD